MKTKEELFTELQKVSDTLHKICINGDIIDILTEYEHRHLLDSINRGLKMQILGFEKILNDFQKSEPKGEAD